MGEHGDDRDLAEVDLSERSDDAVQEYYERLAGFDRSGVDDTLFPVPRFGPGNDRGP